MMFAESCQMPTRCATQNACSVRDQWYESVLGVYEKLSLDLFVFTSALEGRLDCIRYSVRIQFVSARYGCTADMICIRNTAIKKRRFFLLSRIRLLSD
jgi:hypothetical protein